MNSNMKTGATRGEPGAPPAVRLSGVDYAYPTPARSDVSSLVLNNLDLEIPAATITALLGPNGAGKTTLMNVILGWLTPCAGSVSVFGRDTRGTSRGEMGRTLSLVPQDEHIPFEYTILDYVLLGRAPHLGPLQAPRPYDLAIARNALETVGLEQTADQNIAETSGGEKQLAMVARAIAQEPGILLMDEPTAHLDLKNKRRAVDLIHRLHRQGVTIILTTHDPEFAVAAANRMVLLEQGNLLAEGPIEAVMTEENLSRAFSMSLSVRTVPGKHTVVIW